ncbi:hypothetical protein HDV01_001550 [Terramyces sp. JEL0728]|nr:hypothetical protein HDV01_001550 [Terramyces sp. JEL0728]
MLGVMISHSSDSVSFLTYTKLSLEDKAGSVDANGECWFKKYIKEFASDRPNGTHRKYTVNRVKYEVIYQDEESVKSWDVFFQSWVSAKKGSGSLLAKSALTSSSFIE